MRLLVWLGLTLAASLAAAWFLWGDVLRTLPTAPIPPTARERQLGHSHRAETAILDQRLPAPLPLAGSFEQVIDQLDEAGHVRIFVNWRGLKRAGITPELSISADLS